MEVREMNGGTLIQGISKDEFDLDKTLRLGQSFRWTKCAGGFWYGVICGELCVVTEVPDGIFTTVAADKAIAYFDLETDYTHMFDGCELTDYERRVLQHNRGMHILQQDLLEMLISITISQRTQMPRIRASVNEICERCTEPQEIMFAGCSLQMHPFPTLEQLSVLTLADYKDIGLGYRAEYVFGIVQRLLSRPGELDHIKTLKYPQSVEYLKTFRGVGDKVANCVALFALHQLDAFPVDTHINQVLERHYPYGVSLSKFNGYAGVIQQYMFSDETN